MINLIIADDHKIHLEGLAALLSKPDNIEVIDTATTGVETISSLEYKLPDILILDLNMPKKDGFWVLEQVRKRWPNQKVLVMSSYKETSIVEQAKVSGANGYILKTSDTSVLLDAIQAIYLGGEYFLKSKGSDLSILSSNKEISNEFSDVFLKKYSLSEREAEILVMMANSMSTDQIATKLFLSAHTISTHRKNIKRKLRLENLADLIRFAFENDLL